MSGMEMGSLYILSFFVILLLAFYYILERKHNGIKLDIVLLCGILTFGLISILTVCLQGTRTFTDGIDGAVGTISFSPTAKFQYILQIIILKTNRIINDLYFDGCDGHDTNRIGKKTFVSRPTR